MAPPRDKHKYRLQRDFPYPSREEDNYRPNYKTPAVRNEDVSQTVTARVSSSDFRLVGRTFVKANTTLNNNPSRMSCPSPTSRAYGTLDTHVNRTNLLLSSLQRLRAQHLGHLEIGLNLSTQARRARTQHLLQISVGASSSALPDVPHHPQSRLPVVLVAPHTPAMHPDLHRQRPPQLHRQTTYPTTGPTPKKKPCTAQHATSTL